LFLRSGVSEGQGLPAKKIEELAFQCCDIVYGKEDSGPYETLRYVFEIYG
jgi:dynactin 1